MATMSREAKTKRAAARQARIQVQHDQALAQYRERLDRAERILPGVLAVIRETLHVEALAAETILQESVSPYTVGGVYYERDWRREVAMFPATAAKEEADEAEAEAERVAGLTPEERFEEMVEQKIKARATEDEERIEAETYVALLPRAAALFQQATGLVATDYSDEGLEYLIPSSRADEADTIRDQAQEVLDELRGEFWDLQAEKMREFKQEILSEVRDEVRAELRTA